MSDDWIGAIIDAFVIDYVFERPSVIAETMDELGATDVQGLRRPRIPHTSTTAPGSTEVTAPAHRS